MVALIRARGAASEMARLFDADPLPGLDWPDSIWPGDQVPVILQAGDRCRLTTMSWGLPQTQLKAPLPPAQRAGFYSRDLVADASRLRNPGALDHCLIILEAWATPAGRSGQRTRQWTGLWDEPLVAWAALCTSDGQYCAGLVQGRFASGDTKPRLLRPEQAVAWLGGAGLLMLGPSYAAEDFYCEDLGERWSTGRQERETMPLFAA